MKKIRRVFYLILSTLLLMSTIGLASCGEFNDIVNSSNTIVKANIENSYSYYKDKNYKEISEELANLGFSDISVIRMGNLVNGILHSENTIYQMSVNGNTSFPSGGYDVNVPIVFYIYTYDYKCPEGHTIEHISDTAATCTAVGYYECYYCATCKLCYEDSKGNGIPTTIDKYVIETIPHTLTHLSYQDSTCTTDGHIDCYQCTVCNKYFSDSNGLNEISSEDAIIKAYHHGEVVIDARVAPTFDTKGLTEGSHCSLCGGVITKQEEIAWVGSDEEKALASTLSDTFPTSIAKEVVRIAMINYLALDTVDSSGSPNQSLFHSKSYAGTYNQIIGYAGEWVPVCENTWCVSNMRLWNTYESAVVYVYAKVTYNGEYYVVSEAYNGEASDSKKITYDLGETYKVTTKMLNS